MWDAVIFNLQSIETLQANPLRKMTNKMIHRSPDNEGFALIYKDGIIKTYRGRDTCMDDPEILLVQGYPRESIRQHIDSLCFLMKKKGFYLSLQQWMKEPRQSLVQAKIYALKERSLVHADTVTRWFNKYQKSRMPATLIWHLVAPGLWLKHDIDRGRARI